MFWVTAGKQEPKPLGFSLLPNAHRTNRAVAWEWGARGSQQRICPETQPRTQSSSLTGPCRRTPTPAPLPNSSSMAMMISTWSRLSSPRSFMKCASAVSWGCTQAVSSRSRPRPRPPRPGPRSPSRGRSCRTASGRTGRAP